MYSSGCCHNRALTIMNLYVKLTYQISNVKNLGEWNRYALRQGGETWAGAAMPGVRHCNRGSGQLEFGKERRGYGSRGRLGSGHKPHSLYKFALEQTQ